MAEYITVEIDVPTMGLTEPQFMTAWAGLLEHQLEEAKVLLRKTHQNWGQGPAKTPSGFMQKLKNEKIDWFHTISRGVVNVGDAGASVSSGGDGMYGVVYTESKKYLYVNSGTRQRKVKMSVGFAAKTTPHSTTSGPGSGFASHWGVGHGIAPREFTEAVAEQRFPFFVKASARLSDHLASRFWK